MTEMNREQLESLRKQFPQGTRIQCVENRDGAPIPTGETGTLEHIDEMGLFHCDLDDGRRFIAAIEEGCFQVIPSKQPEQCGITEINKDTFWKLIDQGREQCSQDVYALAQWLESRLMEMGPEQALNFDYVAHAYRAAAYKHGLWSAASILCDGCTDDGFTDFRGWLIAQGRDVYMAALKDPDSLADVPTDGDCCCETFCYVGSYAYEELTGRDINQDFDPDISRALTEQIKPDIVYGDGIGYPYTWSEVAVYLPRLCAKHMTPEELAWRIKYHNDTWNVTSPEIQTVRATEKKSKKIKKNRGESR